VSDKRCSEADVIAEIESGMTVGIGGWGSRRKPMSLVRAIGRSAVRDLTIVSYGGPDVGLLCATGQVCKVISAFVSLDSIPLEPHYRAARQAGRVQEEPWDEGLFLLGLQAAAWRVPFLPSRAGLGSDLLELNPRLTTVRSPFADGEELVAAPALQLDVALCHLNVADAGGNAAFLGPDLYFDDLFLRAARRRFLSVERIVATGDLLGAAGTEQRLRINRTMVDGLVERPGAAHFTSCVPEYERDEAFQRRYAASARSPEDWANFRAQWLDLSEDEYQARVAAAS
jgi:glutaconate CoA-transferase subunit A